MGFKLKGNIDIEGKHHYILGTKEISVRVSFGQEIDFS